MNLARQTIRKVPEVTVYFWIIKILTTGMGETASDYLVHRLDPILAVAVGGIGLSVSLVAQFLTHRYITWVYWLAVAMVAVFGTMAADVLHVELGISYLVSTAVFAVVLGVLFVVWYSVEKTLSIHSIYTFRRETFYWATVMATFALGTAVGDMTATTFHLGYFSSGILFGIFISIPALAYWRFKVNETLAFWVAYIVTRPLGASFADWVAVSPARGGLGLDYGSVSLTLIVLIVVFVSYLAASRIDVKRRRD
jgi:uncharacterized membrane-anchored protein